jgi:hypothetical protein
MATTNEQTTGRKKPGPKPGSKGAAAKKAAASLASTRTPTGGGTNGGDAPAAADKPAAPAVPQGERSPFLYKNHDYLTVTDSGQKGQVRARTEYANGGVAYHLAYVSNGEMKHDWFDQDMLSPFVERRARP